MSNLCPEYEKHYSNIHLINSFAMIGWPDLSVKGDRKPKDELIHKQSYPAYKYDSDKIPWCLYIPTDEIIIKIIRLCIYITDCQDLFIFEAK
jgi:hypothetical protein